MCKCLPILGEDVGAGDDPVQDDNAVAVVEGLVQEDLLEARHKGGDPAVQTDKISADNTCSYSCRSADYLVLHVGPRFCPNFVLYRLYSSGKIERSPAVI